MRNGALRSCRSATPARNWALQALLLAAIPRITAAGGGGSARWWCDEDIHKCYNDDYSYVESVIIVVLVCFALIFEAAHHVVVHAAEHTYFYGKLQTILPADSKAKDHSRHSHFELVQKNKVPLFKHLVDRLAEEFMILGFLAFLVFVFREAGGFEKVVILFPPDDYSFKLPSTAEDWLHMVENVHMKLFMGMIIYFALISRVVSGCVKSVAGWEEMRIIRRSNIEDDGFHTQIDNTQLRRYGRWRVYFLQSVMNWKTKRPKLYQETLRRLASINGCTPSQAASHRMLFDNFPFSAYLAYSVRECCKDTVDVHRITWASLLLIFIVFCLLHRYAGLIVLHIMPVFIVASFVLILVLRHLVRGFRERVENCGTRALNVGGTGGGLSLPGSFSEADIEAPAMGATSTVATTAETAVVPARTTASSEATVQAARTTASSKAADNRSTKASSASSMNQTETMYESNYAFAVQDLQELNNGSFHERHNSEIWVLRMLQIVLFVICTSCARTVGDPNDWRTRPKEVLAVFAGFAVLLMVLASLLPSYVPMFSALMALPPYVDQVNVRTFFEVLEEYSMPHLELQHEQAMGACGSIAANRRVSEDNQESNEGATRMDPKKYVELENAMQVMCSQQKELTTQVQDMHGLMMRRFRADLGETERAQAPEVCLNTSPAVCLQDEVAIMRAQLERLEKALNRTKSLEESHQTPIELPGAFCGQSENHAEMGRKASGSSDVALT